MPIVRPTFPFKPRQAQRKYQQAKDAYGKAKHQPLTVQEFAAYYDLPLAEVIERL